MQRFMKWHAEFLFDIDVSALRESDCAQTMLGLSRRWRSWLSTTTRSSILFYLQLMHTSKNALQQGKEQARNRTNIERSMLSIT